MSENNITAEERELIKSRAVSGLRTVIDTSNELGKRAAYQQQMEVEEKQRQEYGKRWQEAEERKQRQLDAEYERQTEGRHRLLKGPRSVLFTDEQDCQFCSAKVKFVLPGWNMNAKICGLSDLTIPFDPSYTDSNFNHSKPHICESTDALEFCKILSKQITALNKKLDQAQEFNKTYFRHQPFL